MQHGVTSKKKSRNHRAYILYAVLMAFLLDISHSIPGRHLSARENKSTETISNKKIKSDTTLTEWAKRIEHEKKSVLVFTRRITGQKAVPSSVVALVHGNTVILKEAYLTRTDRMFPAASHTKFFTTLAIMQLEDRGLLDIDKPVSTYIPISRALMKTGSVPVTIRHILSHTSGMAPGRGSARIDLGAPIPPISIHRQAYPAGHRFFYSNQGYNLLGGLIASVTGKNLGEYITDNIITPLEMPTAVAPPYTTGANGISWSLNDMVIFLKLFLGKGALNGKRIVSESWFDEIYRQNRVGIFPGKYKSFRGLCWRVWTVDNRPYSANHASLWPGSGGWMQIYPTLNVAYIFMSDSPFFWEKSPEFKAYYFLMQRRLNRLAGMLSSADLEPASFSVRRERGSVLAALAGDYVDPRTKMKISISSIYPYLYVHFSESARHRLAPVSEDRFMRGGERYLFVRHEGRVLGIIINDRYYIRQYQDDRQPEQTIKESKN